MRLFFGKHSQGRRAVVLITLLAASSAGILPAQDPPDPALYQAMRWRHIGPFLGGRVTAVSGSPAGNLTY